MHRNITLLFLIILLSAAACQRASTEVPLPTRATLPTITPQPTQAPVQVTSPLAPTEPPTATVTDTPTATQTPQRLVITAQPSLTPATPTFTPTLLPDVFAYGESIEDRDLVAYRFGSGSATVMLVGGIHAGAESITVRLMEQLIEHYQDSLDDIPRDVNLLIIPVANPDGYVLGEVNIGRFNAREVDLNRNWDCGWEDTAYWGESEVNPGREPFSEPETIALGGLIQQVQPRAVLFYHAAARGVFSGRCGDEDHSSQLATVYGEASGYPYGEPFTDYVVTGTAPAWVNSIGIPAADIELSSIDDTEYVRNLRAVEAVLQWVSAQARIRN